MDVSYDNINLNDSNNSTSIDTSNNINASDTSNINKSEVNTTTYQTNNSNDKYNIEEVDLSSDEDMGFFQSIGKGIDSGLSFLGGLISDGASAVGGFFADAGQAIYETGADIVNGVSSWVSDRFDELKGIGSNLLETAANLASNVVSITGIIGNWVSGTALPAVGEFFSNLGSSIYDTGASIIDGIGSWFVDRYEDLKGLGSNLAETAANLASNVASIAGVVGNWVTGTALPTIGNFFSNIATGLSQAAAELWDGFVSAVDRAKETVAGWGISILSAAADLAGNIKSILSDFGKWVTETALPAIGNAIISTGASILNTITGLLQGVGQFVEALVDTASIILTGVASIISGAIDLGQWISGKITGNENWHSVTKELWNKEMDFVKNEFVNNAFNKFHTDTGFGKWLDENAYAPFKSDGMAYKIANGVGYIAGIIALTIATMGVGTAATGAASGASVATASSSSINLFGLATVEVTKQACISGTIAAAAGLGKNTQAAWNDGAGLLDGLAYGGAMGLWEGFEMFLGAEINTLKVADLFGLGTVGQQIVNTGAHVALDTLDGASASFINPLIQMIYNPNETNMEEIMHIVNYDENGNQISNKTWDDLSFGEKYDALFKYNGGWSGVITAAASAGAISFLTEIPDIAKAVKGTKAVETIAAVGATGAAELAVPKTDIELYLEKYILDPDVTPPMGISQEVIDFLDAYKKNPDITLPKGMPQEVVDFVNGKAAASQIGDSSIVSSSGASSAGSISDSGDAVAASAKSITSTTASKKIVEMTEEEIHAAIKSEMALLDPNSLDYAQKVAMLQEKEALEIELARRMSGVVDTGSATKSIDLLDSTSQQQAKEAAQEVYDKAIATEASVTASMKKLADSEASLEGLDFRTKSIDSIEDKIARKVYQGYSVYGAKGSINDSLRYTLVVTGDYETTVLSKLKMLQGDGFDIVDLNNAWGNSTYQGLNVTLKNPDGVLVELQFHTPSSFNTKQVVNHELYELSRNTSTSTEVRNISNKIQALNQQIYVGNGTHFSYYDPYSLKQAVDNFTLKSAFKNYKKPNGYEEFLTENQQNIDTWNQLVYDDPTVGDLMWEYKGESTVAPTSYKIANGKLRGTLFDDSTRTVTITGSAGYKMTYSYDEYEKIVGCTIEEFKVRIDESVAKLSDGISQCHLATDTELTRGVNWDTLEFLFGIKEGDSIDVINAKLAAKGVWTEPGFISACPNVDVGDLPYICGGKPIRLVMECEAGINARVFPSDWEKEVLLDYGQSFKIRHAEVAPDGAILIYMTHIAN